MDVLCWILILLQGKPPVIDEHASSQPLDRPPETPRLEVGSSPTPALSDISISQHYAKVAQMVQELRLSMPFTCPWLDPQDIKLVGMWPIGVGDFTDIWEATCDSRKVLLKSYRCRDSSDDAKIAAVCSNRSLCRMVHC